MWSWRNSVPIDILVNNAGVYEFVPLGTNDA